MFQLLPVLLVPTAHAGPAPINFSKLSIEEAKEVLMHVVENCERYLGDNDTDGKYGTEDDECKCEYEGDTVVCYAASMEVRCEQQGQCSARDTKGMAWDVRWETIMGGVEGEDDIIPKFDFYFSDSAVPGYYVGVGGALQPGMIIVDANPDAVMHAIETGTGEVSFAIQLSEGLGRDGIRLRVHDEGDFGGWVTMNDLNTGLTASGPAGVINTWR